jgi:ubiquinone/menaquinone biosynthesis C-methylase UbiE
MVSNASYIHSLRYQWLNRFYDPVVRLSTRESAVKKALVSFLPPLNQGKVLDLACGTGTLSRVIKTAKPAFNIHGIDGDKDMLDRARKKARMADLDIYYDHGFAQQLPYDDSTFDVVTSSLFFHHLTADDKRAAFREVYRVMKPKGLFLVADWGRPQNFLMRMTFGLVQLLDGFETTADNVRGALPAMMEEAGLSPVDHLRTMATPLGTITLLRASS